ncbi:MAG: hypothetical protein OXB95_01610 [Rhodobacteraceae bacterium]|nr:hypothetical protein [Paracoccaceae bacterium]
MSTNAQISNDKEKLCARLSELVDAGMPVEAFDAFEDGVRISLQPKGDIADVENAVLDGSLKLGRVLLVNAVTNLDDKARSILLGGESWHRVSEAPKRIVTKLGTVVYRRSCYRRRDKQRQHCPVDERLGLFAGCMTRPAAKHAVYQMTGQTTQEATDTLASFGAMQPSSSMLRRVMQDVHERWRLREVGLHATLAAGEETPREAVSFLVSLEGAMLQMRKGEPNVSESDWREASCGALTFHDKDSNLLGAIYFGRMPEWNKFTLKRLLTQEIERVREQQPDLVMVGASDGAVDNWTWLDRMGADHLVIDCWHATQHLWEVAEHLLRKEKWFERQRSVLLEDPQGVEKIIRALRFQRMQAKNAKNAEAHEVIEKALGHFRQNRRHMQYHSLRQAKLPIGSGLNEAAKDLLINRRMKRPRMHWSMAGGQAVMTFRALLKSGRFDTAWDLLTEQQRRK